MFSTILPIKHLVVLLQFTTSSKPKFFHQAAITAFLRHLLDNIPNYEQYFCIDTPESGRLNYQEGDFYRFSIFAFQGADHALQDLIEKLQQLPLSVNKTDTALAFKNNLRCISLQDGFSTLPIQSSNQLSEYTQQQLNEEMALWKPRLNNKTAINIRWLSPVRLKKSKTKQKGEQRYCHNQDDLSIELLFERLHSTFTTYSRNKSSERIPWETLNVPEAVFKQNHCFWIDNAYYDQQAKAKPIGGMLGFQSLQIKAPISDYALAILVLGQYLGIGERRGFGLGRYCLETTCQESSCQESTFRRVYPAQSILIEILDKDNLDQALSHNHQDEYDDEDPDDNKLLEIVQSIEHSNYQAPPLSAYLIRKNNGAQRLLMVPPFWDRVMQRAFAQVLAAKLETIMDPHSYGFRRGRSRLNAKFDIQLAYRDGYHWVYESDIQDFFNQVDIDKLMIRLRGLFGNDPALIWIEKWLFSDFIYAGKTFSRQMGLAQGSPISPVLANLFLDDFDNDMALAGFRLVRFADDFVILCKTQAQAQQAALQVEASLTEHGLSLNTDKTSIKSMQQGFYYLGYLFVNDMVLEAHKPDRKPSSIAANFPLPVEVAETFHLDQPKALDKNLDGMAQQKPMLSVPSHNQQGNQQGIFLCLQGKPKSVFLSQGRIRVMEKETKISEHPLSFIQAIVLMGNHQITTQAMQACMKAAVPIYFSNSRGKFLGCNWNYQPQYYGADFWLQQQYQFTQLDKALSASILIVQARITSQIEVLRQRQSSKTTALIENIKSIYSKVANAQSLQELNGYEGNASRYYFSALAHIIPEDFGFSHRNRRPPKDPINVLLSMGYTLLYN